ncbi:hypothetical protein [Variovorax sp. GT1P44]|uniref:hypothetical protein n=1 Tax=Variovorax sp. GT1P44 TaxID=3443742 RepID=UPI003F481A02
MTGDAFRYLTLAMADAGVIELRHEHDGRWQSGTFNRLELLRTHIEARAGVGNLYATLNRPRADLPVPNGMGGDALCDADMAVVVRLPFDFDPLRDKGVASSDAELALAAEARGRLVAALSSLGWPLPALATSGNGTHALYRVHLPANEATREMLDAAYRGLWGDFTTEEVMFDRPVRNAARIWRLYGTTNRKGGSPTTERPHRLASVRIPSPWRGVSPREVERLAEGYVRRACQVASVQAGGVRALPVARARRAPLPRGQGAYDTLDIVQWFKAHDAYFRALGAGKHAVACPWADEHSSRSDPRSTSTVIWECDGSGKWPTFHCSHAHCEERELRDVMRAWGDADAWCAHAWRPAPQLVGRAASEGTLS